MIILIKGDQGQGKTTKAEALIKTYEDEAVKRLDVDTEGLVHQPNRFAHILETHVHNCETKGKTPLFVFDDLSPFAFDLAYENINLLSRKVGLPQIDAILITNIRLFIQSAE